MKRTLALFVSVLMLLTMIPLQSRAVSENVTFTVTADKNMACPGDTIHYSVSIGAVNSLGGITFSLIIPEGLTIVDNSLSIPEGLAGTLDSFGDIVPPSSLNRYTWSYAAQSKGYTGNGVTLLTFSCTVNADAAYEAKNVSVLMDTCFDNELAMNDHTVNIVPASVDIVKAPVYVSSVALDKNTLELKEGESGLLTATVWPEDADTKTVSWSSSNRSVATVEDGTVNAVGIGSATITVTTDDGGKTASCTVTVSCNHNMLETAGVEATCGKAGILRHYTCTKCNKMFVDEAGTKEVMDVSIPATGLHGETEIKNAVDATEDAEGYTGDTYCTVCHQKLSDGTKTDKLPHTHSMSRTEAVAPGCETVGNIEYYTCSKCHKKYSDAAGTKEVTNTALAATGHSAETAWDSDESGHWKVCAVCGVQLDEKESHTFIWIVDTPATITSTGVKHEECECGFKRNENTEMAMLDHEHTEITYHEATASTCAKEGNISYWSCSHENCKNKCYSDAGCQLEIADVTLPIDSSAHVFDDENDAVCNECGYQRVYTVIEGAGSEYTEGSDKGISIRIDGAFSKFDHVKVDGNVVAEENYTVTEGSTLITFKPEYLNGLSKSVHSVEVVYTDGNSATTSITVKAAAQKPDTNQDTKPNTDQSQGTDQSTNQTEKAEGSPKTGEGAMSGVLLLLPAALIGGVLVIRRRRSGCRRR